ncbi:Xaa-Pro aminopeptidase [Alteromonas sp. 1_MG-2023]|uniref:Xaa-Pro aminopeptidase n=1 Tax=Alteromonas sp. 1_MG-2023 TaxID=3062669 RepID=UPI0026E1FA5F|nr:Xaa-Pro aminopeptidase [Alteromonas sp. 1_MG-2023]MDO6568628.1 Xaa-Pro aminopeptidase [Alteromonas sp. 1_MG-2023]
MISAQEFIARQDRLLAKCLPNSVCVIPAAGLVTRSRDTEYLFRQNSDFWYLTGFEEADAWLILSNHPRYGESYRAMVCLPKDKDAEIWQGRRLGAEAALARFSLDEAFELSELGDALLESLQGQDHLYFALGENDNADTQVNSADAQINRALATLRNAPKEALAPTSITDVRPILHEMRVFKSACEVAMMKAAAEITASAHKRAMQYAKPGCYEYQLEAELHHEFAMAGARAPAYSTIVGSGENACILHYTENLSQIQDGDLVLIDAGAEFQGYAADITRTFPVNGKFSKPQRDIYELVLKAQESVLAMLGPGITLPDAMTHSAEVITEGLVDLGVLKGSVAENLDDKAWQQFYMHGLGHFLGLDVHDVGNYKINGQDRLLKPGMVLTVEPGIYIASDSDVPEQYKGIGVRIEDDVVVTATGVDILTADVPKTVQDIEALMQPANKESKKESKQEGSKA